MNGPHEWLRFAGEDLRLAQISLDEGILNQACFKRATSILDRYYFTMRYPDALAGTGPEGSPKQSDAQEAVNLLQDALDWIKKKIE
jgi:HEPN domain-containing protein